MGETEWSLTDGTGIGVLSGGPYSSNRIHNVDACLIPGTYTFKISDEYGDGMCCKYGPGYFKLWLEGAEIYKGGEFEVDDTHVFTVSALSEVDNMDDYIDDFGSTG